MLRFTREIDDMESAVSRLFSTFSIFFQFGNLGSIVKHEKSEKKGSGIFVKMRIGMKHLLCKRISLFVWLESDFLSSVSERNHH